MKKIILTATLAVWSLLVLVPSSFADKTEKTFTERFYGKITAIDFARRNVTVHNKKSKMDADFTWNEGTQIVLNKKSIAPTELRDGQSLIISYAMNNGVNEAKKIVVRDPSKYGFKKKTAAE